MISTITHFCRNVQHRTIEITSNSEFKDSARKTSLVALEVLKIAIVIKFFPYTALFALGLGLLFPEEAKFKLDRIAHLVETNKRYAAPIMLIFTVAFLPVAALATSTYIGARMGSRIMLMNMPQIALEEKN